MTQAYTRIRILGDETSKLDREKNWLRKNFVTDYAEKMFHQATLENYGQAEMQKNAEMLKKMKTIVNHKMQYPEKRVLVLN